MNKTITPTPKMVKEEILKPEMLDKQWYVIDATDQRLGRLASAKISRSTLPTWIQGTL